MSASWYRRHGADPPFGDPRRAHGVLMEGYYWRVTDAQAGRVVIALCGVCRAADGTWALVALAAHPGPFVRTAVLGVARADGLTVRADDPATGMCFAASLGPDFELAVDLGEDARLDLRTADEQPWPRRVFGGIGPAQVVPRLPQYWHPHLLHAPAAGWAQLGDERVALDGASVYSEKNWGSTFSRHWWWGQAHGFPEDPRACVAFAGGPIRLAGVPLAPTAIVASFGDDLVRLGAPLARTQASARGDEWRIRGRGPLHSIEIEGEGEGGSLAVLPTPVVEHRTTEPRSHHVLAGRMNVTLRRGTRTLLRAESRLAGLERAVKPDDPDAVRLQT